MLVGPDGAVHLLWTERAIDERLREKFFPAEKQTHTLMYAIVREGKVVLKRPLLIGGEGAGPEIPGSGRFHVTEDGRLYVFFYVGGESGEGESISQNRIMRINPDGTPSEASVVDLKHPFRRFFTTTWRAGCRPSSILDIYGTCTDKEDALSYARIRIK